MTDPDTRPLLPRPLAGLGGLVAAGAGLAVAEAVVALSSRLRSPVLDVGDRVVDRVPVRLKTLAISWFGTNDKKALLVGIALVLGLLAAAIGVAWFGRHRPLALIGVVAFGAIGAAASLLARSDRPWWVVTPSLVGALAAAAILLALDRWAPDTRARALRPAPLPNTGVAGYAGRGAGRIIIAGGEPARVDRRRFIVGVGVVAAAAVAVGEGGRRLQRRFSAAESRSTVVLPPPAQPAGALPAGVNLPLAGITPYVTPNGQFYRIDTALTVPQVALDGWSLRVSGMVDRELRLSYADLLDRPLTETDITLTCVSNEVGGSLAGNARWLGVRLDDLLADAGLRPEADQIVGRSVDGYTCGFPVEALDGRPALVAVAMNGEPLPLEHGFPARLIVPGLYGYVSATKWLSSIEATRFDAFDQYWVPRGYAARAPIKMQSRIDTPRGLASLSPGPVPIGGVAWAQPVGISRVEIRIDEGEWVDTVLADEASGLTWRQWFYNWQAEPGRHAITVRATDANGAIQTADRSEPLPDGASGQHQIVVLVNPR